MFDWFKKKDEEKKAEATGAKAPEGKSADEAKLILKEAKYKCFRIGDKWAAALKIDLGDDSLVQVTGPYASEEDAERYLASEKCINEAVQAVMGFIVNKAQSELAADEKAKEAVAKAARKESA